jgi:hypothetical protein
MIALCFARSTLRDRLMHPRKECTQAPFSHSVEIKVIDDELLTAFEQTRGSGFALPKT